LGERQRPLHSDVAAEAWALLPHRIVFEQVSVHTQRYFCKEPTHHKYVREHAIPSGDQNVVIGIGQHLLRTTQQRIPTLSFREVPEEHFEVADGLLALRHRVVLLVDLPFGSHDTQQLHLDRPLEQNLIAVRLRLLASSAVWQRLFSMLQVADEE